MSASAPSTDQDRNRAPLSLYSLKPAFVARLRRVEDAAQMRGISPNTLTFTAVGLAALTGACLIAGVGIPLLWLAVAPLGLARMACNAVDGSLARRTDGTSARGAVYNELGDRLSDAVTFAALAPAIGAPLALSVVVVALSTSLVAVTASAVVGERMAVGPMGKPDRVAVISAAAACAALAGPGALVAGAWVIIVLGCITVIRRTSALQLATRSQA